MQQSSKKGHSFGFVVFVSLVFSSFKSNRDMCMHVDHVLPETKRQTHVKAVHLLFVFFYNLL